MIRSKKIALALVGIVLLGSLSLNAQKDPVQRLLAEEKKGSLEKDARLLGTLVLMHSIKYHFASKLARSTKPVRPEKPARMVTSPVTSPENSRCATPVSDIRSVKSLTPFTPRTSFSSPN